MPRFSFFAVLRAMVARWMVSVVMPSLLALKGVLTQFQKQWELFLPLGAMLNESSVYLGAVMISIATPVSVALLVRFFCLTFCQLPLKVLETHF